MKEELEVKERSFLVPFLVGGLVGAALGLLLAPKPGREMRKQIKDFAVDTREKMGTAIDKGKELYGEAKTALSSAVEAGKQAYAEEREKVLTAH